MICELDRHFQGHPMRRCCRQPPNDVTIVSVGSKPMKIRRRQLWHLESVGDVDIFVAIFDRRRSVGTAGRNNQVIDLRGLNTSGRVTVSIDGRRPRFDQLGYRSKSR